MEPSPTPKRRGLAHLLTLLIAALFCMTSQVRAQWVTESYSLETGWNGIWVSQDCTHATIDELLANELAIEEVWLWNPVGGAVQFSLAPTVPLASDVAWQVWRRGNPAETTLTKLLGGSAYLIKVSGAPFTLSLTGRPLPPRLTFSGTGQNLVGFPLLTPDSSTLRSVENFFSNDAVLRTNPPVFEYVGGALSETVPKNPLRISRPRTTALSRGKAYWVNTTQHTRFYGPVEVTVLGSTLDFGSTRGFVTVRLRNAIDPAKNLPITATLAPAPSATPPTGEVPIAGAVPLLVRGPRDADTLDFTYDPLGAAGISRTLAPGEQTEVTLALDRTVMGSTTGDVFQSLLQVTDSLDLTRIDLGVRAEVPSFTGIWIGAAVVTKVDQIIGQSVDADEPAPSNFPIRLILHRTDAGQVTALQQVYLGAADEAPLASTDEAAITAAATGEIARFTSASFPPGSWDASNDIGVSGVVNFTVPLGYNAPTNPFVHNYHPDHDNMDARFESFLPVGVESPEITRAITLTFTPTLPGVTDNGIGSTTLGGTYQETITGLRADPISVSGAFVLRRIAPAPTLLPAAP